MKNSKLLSFAAVALIAFFLLSSSIYYIEPGYRGVLNTLGHIDQTTYTNGVGLKWPFISSMEKMDVRTQNIQAKTSSYTSDVQTADIEYVVTYSLNQENVYALYENVGMDYRNKKIMPILNDVLKDAIGRWQAQDLVANRDKARVEILKGLVDRLDKRFFTDITFQFINIDYSDQFEKAIENKVIAEQKAQEAKNNTHRIKEEAEQKVISAKAEAEAMRVKSQALAENQKLVEYEAVLKWNGILPQYMFSDKGAVPMIQIPGIK